jgi:hypothetical protein
MKAIHIDATAREFRAVDYTDIKDLQRLVGGYIETAWRWPDTDDVLYVDEEGYSKPQQGFLRVAGRRDGFPLAGNGVVVGHEIVDAEGEYYGTAAPKITIEALAKEVTFLTREQAAAWAKGNASEPMTIFTGVLPDGTVTREVVRRYGHLFDDMPDGSPTAEQHLAWCKQRALEYLPDKPAQAAASMIGDLGKHPATRDLQASHAAAGATAALQGAEALRAWIEGIKL